MYNFKKGRSQRISFFKYSSSFFGGSRFKSCHLKSNSAPGPKEFKSFEAHKFFVSKAVFKATVSSFCCHQTKDACGLIRSLKVHLGGDLKSLNASEFGQFGLKTKTDPNLSLYFYLIHHPEKKSNF